MASLLLNTCCFLESLHVVSRNHGAYWISHCNSIQLFVESGIPLETNHSKLNYNSALMPSEKFSFKRSSISSTVIIVESEKTSKLNRLSEGCRDSIIFDKMCWAIYVCVWHEPIWGWSNCQCYMLVTLLQLWLNVVEYRVWEFSAIHKA